MRHRRQPLNQPLPLTGLLISLGLLSLPLGCQDGPAGQGGGEGATVQSGGTTGSCAAADPRWCGEYCESDEACPTGMFCDTLSKSCGAQCLAGQAEAPQCSGSTCLPDGRCPAGTGPSGSGASLNVTPGTGGGGAGGTGGAPMECIDVQVDFNPVIPSVMLLIDRSASMNDAEGFGEAVAQAEAAGEYVPWDCGNASDWRWNVVRNVLLNPDSGVVKPLEDRIRFGLSLYSYRPPAGPGPGPDPGSGGTDGSGGGPAEPEATCPITVDVGISLNNHAAMLDAFECSDTLQETPTRESLVQAANTLAAYPSEEPKVIVLATDGAPDNCVCNNWQGDGVGNVPDECTQEAKLQEQADVVAEAARIQAELGITVHVVDVSSPIQTELHDHLTDVAAAGGGQIFDGTNPAGLVDAFNYIAKSVQSCAVDLDGMITAGKESTGVVTLNGQVLELDSPDGWVVNSPTQIELVGASCEAVKAGQSALDISFPCDAFIVKVK